MQTIVVDSWEAFEQRLQELRATMTPAGTPGNFLFRGLSDSSWALTTTLERANVEGTRVCEYHGLISRLQPQIESFTGSSWKIPQFPDVERLLKNYPDMGPGGFPDQATYSYMVHLRHHGFPSPLLDWTRSPYIAAFFAFRSPFKPSADRVSIYAYWEMPEGSKLTSSGRPWMRYMGQYVRTHRRHFSQQCAYTMCVSYESEWHFAKHESAFEIGEDRQDALWKFDIPWAERLKVLGRLDTYNLNAFSLFESEECLNETLALREMQFNK
jgi:hypothetical protein